MGSVILCLQGKRKCFQYKFTSFFCKQKKNKITELELSRGMNDSLKQKQMDTPYC